jgi:NAD(P)-dependent dehydrogenase (short-subunit alcohol dehydrogenase family)
MLGDVLDGRVALVTGAGRGIGREIAAGLAQAGVRVALVSRTQSELDQVAREIGTSGGTAVPIRSDIGDLSQLAGLVRAAEEQLGPVEILINNAAVVTPLGPAPRLAAEQVLTALAVNVGAVVALSGLVIPGMLEAGWGRIVNVSSGVADQPTAMIGGNVYTATKAALEASTLNLAAEFDGTGITANVYRPGVVDTAMQEWIREQPVEIVGEALHERFASYLSSGALITPEASAAALIDRLPTSDSGQIWNVSDRLDKHRATT